MNKLLSVICLFFFGTVLSTIVPNETTIWPAVCSSLPDSVKSMVASQRFIFYSTGHYGHTWSIVYKDGEELAFINGRDYGRPIKSPGTFEKELLKSNLSVFLWGIDTMPEQSISLSSVSTPLGIAGAYSALLVMEPHCGIVFLSENKTAYGGEGQNDFNNKYRRVLFLMNILAMPEIIDYIPDSLLCKYNKLN